MWPKSKRVRVRDQSKSVLLFRWRVTLSMLLSVVVAPVGPSWKTVEGVLPDDEFVPLPALLKRGRVKILSVSKESVRVRIKYTSCP